MNHRILRLAVVLSALSVATGCPKGDVAAGDPATTAPRAPLTAPTPPTANGARFTFDDSTSKITWVGKKITGKHDGSFQKFKGIADVVATDVTKGSVAVVIDMDSITSEPAKLVAHLKSDAFFAVEKNPHAKFTSTSIVPTAAGAAGSAGAGTHTVNGTIEIRGVSKPVSFPATIRVTETSAELDGDMTINRQDFGVAYQGKADDLIEDNVTIHLEIRAKKEG